jgi:hypothetical protein
MKCLTSHHSLTDRVFTQRNGENKIRIARNTTLLTQQGIENSTQQN